MRWRRGIPWLAVLGAIAAALWLSHRHGEGYPANAPALGHRTTPLGQGACHYRILRGAALPDPRCTPGATNPAVSPATVRDTVCRRGWTSTVRPPLSYTAPLKRRLMKAYGAKGPASAYELDHLVPLDAGGAPYDPANLWPEPYSSARYKDDEEVYAGRLACASPSALRRLQHELARDWVGAYLRDRPAHVEFGR